MIGLNLDGAINTHVRDCVFKPHSNVAGSDLENVGVLIADKNQYRLHDAHATISLSLEGINACGRYGVLDFGGYNHRFRDMMFTSCKTCMLLGSGGPFHVTNAYHESTLVCHYETDYSGQLFGLTLDDLYIANALKVPFLFNRLESYCFRITDLYMQGGGPDGSESHPYGLSKAMNNRLIQDQPDFAPLRFGMRVVDIKNWLVDGAFGDVLPSSLVSDSRVAIVEDRRGPNVQIQYYRVLTASS